MSFFQLGRLGSAAAQTAAERETARLLMDRGDERVDKGDFVHALDFYRGANEIMHVPTTGIEVARSYAALGNLVEARDAALEVLRMKGSPNDPAPFEAARAAAGELARELADQIPLLVIEVAPDEAVPIASLSVDGRPVPRAIWGLPSSLNPGEHLLQLVAPHYRPTDLSLTLTRGDRRTVHLEMLPLPAERTAASPGQPAAPPVAEHRAASPRTTPSGTRLTWPVWLGVGIGGTGLLVGTIAGIVSLERASDAREYCSGNSCSPEAGPDRDAAVQAAHVSNFGWATAALGAALSVTSWWLSGRAQPAKPTSSVSLATAPGGGLLLFRGEL